MIELPASIAVPLRFDESGAVRVGKSRVLLVLVIHAFQDGATPETIVQSYDTLQLADVYAVLAYYLTHKQDVEEYLQRNEDKAAAIQRKIEAEQPSWTEWRAQLLARRAPMEQERDTLARG